MKQFANLLTLLFIILLSFWSIQQQLPTYKPDQNIAVSQFSTDRALEHVLAIAEEPHGVGQKAHQQVRDYIVQQLRNMNLDVNIQEGYNIGGFGNLSNVQNIVSRIPGTEKGKSLLLLSHYDSGLHSSYGASDAGSGVATILEGVRAFLAQGKQPKNDIIIVLSDAEEIGLNGAELFANKHPWAENLGLVLNFEARGSGGPSYMLLETNGGNKKLIQAFDQAQVPYPVSNSLLYSIYKSLPNDTDLTVFREQKDIDGFNFAFIDDHFDYHTALDNYERLDRNTLAHQGSYLMPLLQHFSQADLGELKAEKEHVYFNIPIAHFVHYPFDLIWIIYGFTLLLFIATLWYGFKKSLDLQWKNIGKGFIPFLVALVVNGLIGFYGPKLLLYLYPAYGDMLHGFPYNGHAYIFMFVFLSLAILFYTYKKFNPVPPANLMIAPLTIWLVLCALINIYLAGASFLIIPVFLMLIALGVIFRQEKPNVFLLLLLSLSAIFMIVPMIAMLPVGLGLKMMVLSTIFTTLCFGLLLPVVAYYRSKGLLSVVFLLLAVIFFFNAHNNSSFDKQTPKPSSLVYYIDTDTKEAYWASYDKVLIDWNKAFIRPEDSLLSKQRLMVSKYSKGFEWIQQADYKPIEAFELQKSQDTIIGNDRHLTICFSPKRAVDRLEVRTNDKIDSCSVNGIPLSKNYLQKRRNKLFTHFVSNNDATELYLRIPKDQKITLECNEASNDLLSNTLFSIPKRPKESIPLPFVLNDAIITKTTVQFE
ncbi:MAG: M28 family peptidase [Flavobacteriaceae bacterium]|nr:M28 family peptidase [Flavobacteriaceae bacterium]